MSGKGKHAQASAEAASSTLDPVVGLGKFAILLSVLWTAYTIRLHAVNVYGRVIHKKDPWFNFRATQYLVDNGAHAFWNWYDVESWYPLGRPVGTTIYAGLQFTSAYIYYALQALGMPMSLNDVCVFVPAWFGPITTLFVAGMTYEASFSTTSALAAAFFMSISPAHLMRSVAGGYDNEGIAVAAICGTFYFWMRAVRTPSSWPFAFLAAIMYVYMVSAWGGYVFVLNMVGFSCGVMLVSSLMGLCPQVHAKLSREPYVYGKRALSTWQKSPMYMAKEPYVYGKRALCIWQKRLMYMAKEPYVYGKRGKRALCIWQKRPISVP